MRYSFLHIIGLAGVVFVMPFSVFSQPFTDIAASVGVADAGPGRGVAWGDADQDGDLDLYLARSGETNRLYRNNGNGTFTDVGGAAGVDNNDEGRSVAWGDYDNDGHLDLYLVNDGPNRLFRNQGDGTFEEISSAAGVSDSGKGQAVAWGDYDNDGDLDLYVSNGRGGIGLGGAPSRLYRNNGNGTFTDVAGSARVDDDGDGRGVAWADYDNDGDLDLYLANSGPDMARLEPDVVFHNNGDGTFSEVTELIGVDNLGKGHGVTFADYDGDGDVDVVMALGMSKDPSPSGSLVWYENDGHPEESPWKRHV
ncbi:MAG: VCBS repeat-containing protein, partial [Candidatus Latescibacteria bacterium]|nr:VCBS repeat-containing protein [Candidatus Latescibacterota bacterium]